MNHNDMNHAEHTAVIQQAKVLSVLQIAAHAWHLKLQGSDFKQMQYLPGFTLDMYIGNPFEVRETVDRKYSFWRYDPVSGIADIAICTFSNGKGAHWIKTLRANDTVYFKPPRGKLLVDENAERYLLIGDITALSHLYEINRHLPAGKPVHSLIYAKQKEDIFPDIDLRYPFKYRVTAQEEIRAAILQQLPENLENTVAYILGDPDTCVWLHHYLKEERNVPVSHLKTKPFWKNTSVIHPLIPA